MQDPECSMDSRIRASFQADLEALGISIRPATMSDCLDMAGEMRVEDIRECLAASGSTPKDALLAGLWSSKRCYTVTDVSAEPFAIFGVSCVEGLGDAFPVTGYVWLLGTPILVKNKKIFHRISQAILPLLEEGYDIIGNYIDSRNTIHVRWLKALGFTFFRNVTLSDPNVLFCEFAKITDNANV
jgi:hypothetical protein